VIPAWLRLLSAVLFLAFAGLAFVDGQHRVAAVAAGLGALMLAAWLRYGDVPRASRAFNDRNRERAFELLSKSPFGGRFLAREYRVYHHHVRARCLGHWERWAEAAAEAEAALAVPGIGEPAADCHVVAAQARYHTGDRDAAERHLAAAKSLPHNTAVDKGLARVERMLRPVPVEG
jgi:ATP/maltotriose-dependent transcriptional regulator MalT